MDAVVFLIVYFICINIISMLAMGIDKKRAIKHVWRIPESNLFILAFIGGSIGSIIGMQLFRHKTRKKIFLYGMPAILIVQLFVFFFLLQSSIEFGYI